jgi:threonine synthase
LYREGKRKIVFAVPSGNFGNIAAGLLACKMGLPVSQFIAATNANDTVPRFLETGVYETRPSVQTYANAMDVGAPSNWVRIMDLFDGDREKVKQLVKSYRYTDEQTVEGIAAIYNKFNYVACPHTAIAWLAVQEYKQQNPSADDTFVFLSTAHPCKFPDIFNAEISAKIEVPEQVEVLKSKMKNAIPMAADFELFKKFLLASDRF